MSRVITAVLFLPILLASIWLPSLSLLFTAIVCAAVILGLFEFWALVRRRRIEPYSKVGLVAALILLCLFYVNSFELIPVTLAALIALLMGWASVRGSEFEKIIPRVAATLFGVVYIAVLLGFLLALRTLKAPDGCQNCAARELSFFFLVLMASDTAAYYVGRAVGRHKMAPAISPGKTWEGAGGGLVASAGGAIIAHYSFFPQLTLQAGIPLALVMNVLGVLGDLSESALKRGAGTKDASAILPGHGGVLDRLDSLLFNAPLIYYFSFIYLR